MEKFDLGKFLADSGVNIDTDKREQIEYIFIDRIDPDPNNFYDLSAIDDLAENISLLGLQQPIRVRPMPEDESKYIIISGHRRHAALKLLIEQDGREDLRDVPCIVDRSEENPKLTQLKLIYANASTRVVTSAEQAKQAEQVEKLLYELKEDGMEFPGRMRDHVAQACKMSTGKLARLKVIRCKLIPQFMRMWEEGKLNESVAYALASQVPLRQNYIYVIVADTGRQQFYLSADSLNWRFKQMDDIQKKCDSLSCKSGGKCGHAYIRMQQAAGGKCVVCSGCCLSCHSLLECTFNCPDSAGKKSKLKEKAKSEKKKEAEEKRIKEQPEKDLLATSYSRVSQLRRERNVSAEDVVKTSLGFAYDRNVKRLNEIESGKAVSLQDRMPGGIWANEAKNLIATADLLGCTIDYLLGRTDSPTTAADPAADSEECVNIDTWHTGTPAKPGWYICRIIVDGVEKPMYLRHWYGGKTWQGLMEDIQVVTHWVPVVEEDE